MPLLPPPAARRSLPLLRGIAALLTLGSPLTASDVSSAAVPDGQLPLPVWTQEEWQHLARETALPPLGGLLPGLGENAAHTAPQGGAALSPKYPDAPPALFLDGAPSLRPALSLFLPDNLPGQAQSNTTTLASSPPQPTPLSSLLNTTPEFLAAAEAWPGDDPLIDPGAELAETQAEDLRRFLGYHAEESFIPIVVLLLGGNEKLPASASLDRIAQGSLSVRRAALLVYPVGEPWRARLFLPQAAHEAVSTAFLTRMIEACLSQASASSTPEDQLHEYVVQLSIRLFWLQNEIAKSKTSSLAFADAAQTPPLAEVGPGLEPSGLPSAPAAAQSHILNLPTGSFVTIALMLGILTAVAGRRIILSARTSAKNRRHTRIWTLPDKETEPRFGGAFCGGGGAWGSWK